MIEKINMNQFPKILHTPPIYNEKKIVKVIRTTGSISKLLEKKGEQDPMID